MVNCRKRTAFSHRSAYELDSSGMLSLSASCLLDDGKEKAGRLMLPASLLFKDLVEDCPHLRILVDLIDLIMGQADELMARIVDPP